MSNRTVLRAALGGALVALLFFGPLQAATPMLVDPDGYFHVRFASLGPSAWISHELPSMRFTIFDGGHWVDHQLLFHAWLWPFTQVFELLTAAKLGALSLSMLAGSSFAGLLARRGVAHPGLWTLGLVGVSWFFDFRMLMVRAQSLSLALLLLGLGLAWEGRRYALLILGFVFAWTYHVGLLLIPLSLIAGLSRPVALADRLSPSVYAALGLGLGFALHPQAPDTFSFLWLHTVVKVLNASGLPVGGEWAPASARVWLWAMGPALMVLLPAVLPARSSDARSAQGVALGAILLSCLASKWIEYAAPLTLLAAALSWRDVIRASAMGDPGRWSTFLSRLTRPRMLPGLLLAAGVQAAVVVDGVSGMVRRAELLTPVAAALPPGDCRVANLSWSDYAILFYLAPHCQYLSGLDPHFAAVGDPERSRLVAAMANGEVADLSGATSITLESEFVVVASPRAESAAEADPGLELVVRSGGWTLWRVGRRVEVER